MLFQKKRYQLLPYITIVALEMALGVIISSGIIMLFFATNAVTSGIYLLCRGDRGWLTQVLVDACRIKSR